MFSFFKNLILHNKNTTYSQQSHNTIIFNPITVVYNIVCCIIITQNCRQEIKLLITNKQLIYTKHKQT